MIKGVKTCTKCGNTKSAKEFHKSSRSKDGFRESCKICNGKRDTVARRSLWQKILRAYGGCCANCSRDMPEILSLDHIHGGGEKERREKKKSGGPHMYYWIIERMKATGVWPEEYQLLCHNCNHLKHKCPEKLQEYAQHCGFTEENNRV